MDEWVREEGGTGAEAGPPPRFRNAVAAPRRVPFEPKPLPADLAAAIRRAADTATAHHREVLVSKMTDAVAAYERGRYQEAARVGKQVANETPSVAAVRQLVGLAAYRCGRWREAITQLEAYGQLTDDVDHMPALMDCNRALGKPRKVADLWADLRRRSPGPDVLAEARMVAAGMLADRGDLDGAISLLSAAGVGKALRNPSDRHLRQWYALGDLYERAGDLPRARELFERVARADPDAYDVADRLAALGPPSGRTRPRRPRPKAAPRGADGEGTTSGGAAASR
jgi:tetratricopeptide (TPR) repeat protein